MSPRGIGFHMKSLQICDSDRFANITYEDDVCSNFRMQLVVSAYITCLSKRATICDVNYLSAPH